MSSPGCCFRRCAHIRTSARLSDKYLSFTKNNEELIDPLDEYVRVQEM